MGSDEMYVVLADGKPISEDGKHWKFYNAHDAIWAASKWPLALKLQAQGKRIQVVKRWYKNPSGDFLGKEWGDTD